MIVIINIAKTRRTIWLNEEKLKKFHEEKFQKKPAFITKEKQNAKL